MITASFALVSFFLSVIFSHYLSRPDAWFSVTAEPNERSLHSRPTPHTGGLAILLGFGIGWLFSSLVQGGLDFMGYLLAALIPVALISWWDDHHPLPALYRLLAHLCAAIILISHPVFLPDQLLLPAFSLTLPIFLAVPITMLFIVWMLNLYNFMDGMDGFAGGMAVFGFGTLALLGWWHGEYWFFLLNLLVAMACAGFLTANFPPAKIFMGDVGSSSLGLLAAAFSLWADHANIAALWMSVLLFSPFIVDASVTLLRRLLRGEKIWQAHRSHYYQRLVQQGWGHRKTVLWEYALMAACSLSVLTCQFLPEFMQGLLLLAWVGIYLSLLIGLRNL